MRQRRSRQFLTQFVCILILIAFQLERETKYLSRANHKEPNEVNALTSVSLSENQLESNSVTTTETPICPSNEEQDKAFPPDMPQKLIINEHPLESAQPFLGCDVWYEIADGKRVFFVRPFDDPIPSVADLVAWVASRSHPITLLINNQKDLSFPKEEGDKETWKELLDQPNLHAVYAENVRRWDEYPKLKPLPIGLKWNWKSTGLFSEPKSENKDDIMSMAGSPEESRELFDSKKETLSILLRPMGIYSRRVVGKRWAVENNALNTSREDLYDVLSSTAPSTITWVDLQGKDRLDRREFFTELKKHRFVVCAVGGGLDSHCTWEALVAGTIPIIPESSLDPQFEGLPVWLVNDWNEVTDEAAKEKSEEFASMSFNWKMAFTVGWKEKVYEGLCQLNESDDDQESF